MMKQFKKPLSVVALSFTSVLLYIFGSYDSSHILDNVRELREQGNLRNLAVKWNKKICYVSSPKINSGCYANAVNVFENVTFPNLTFYMELLGFEHYSICSDQKRTFIPEIPVIVSGASSNHYEEAVSMCNNLNNTIRKKYNEMKVIIFDLGIESSDRRDALEHFCGCEVRKFPFSSFPRHVENVKAYTWKPLIISLMLKEFPFVMWIDTSIRFDIYKPILPLFQKAKTCHMQFLTNPAWTVAETCDNKTMEFLKQNITYHLNTKYTEAGWAVYLRSVFVIQNVLKPWVKCALTYGCMLTDTYTFAGRCTRPNPHIRTPGVCHRFDQSVIGIILGKLYKDKLRHILFKRKQYGDVKRELSMEIPKDFLQKFRKRN